MRLVSDVDGGDRLVCIDKVFEFAPLTDNPDKDGIKASISTSTGYRTMRYKGISFNELEEKLKKRGA